MNTIKAPPCVSCNGERAILAFSDGTKLRMPWSVISILLNDFKRDATGENPLPILKWTYQNPKFNVREDRKHVQRLIQLLEAGPLQRIACPDCVRA